MASTFTGTRVSPFILLVATAAGCLQAAPSDKKVSAPALNVLKALIGKGTESKEMADFRMNFKEAPEVKKFGDCFYHSWKDHGLSFRFVEKERGSLSSIFLYADGADGFKQYRGELPEGLQFADTRRDVEKKLGVPEKSGGAGESPFWVAYPKKGVTIAYVSKDISDLANKIHTFEITTVQGK